MPETEIELVLKGTDRRTIRKYLIGEFLKEEEGAGKGDLSSIYYYYVEEIADGERIYLKRPASLNKGMDFEVRAYNTVFENKNKKSGNIRRSSRPSHSTILKDLRRKKEERPKEYKKVRALIEGIYLCEEVSDDDLRSLLFKSGHPIELTLKIVKWLFIEQDVTYWNWSGRKMFFDGICDI